MTPKEDGHVYLKVSIEEDDCEVTTLTYKQLVKLNTKLIEERDKLKKNNLEIKEYIEFLENRNKPLGYEITDIRNKYKNYETHVSMKNKVKDLHETLSISTKRKESINFVLLNKRHAFNKNGIGFNPHRSFEKITRNRKKLYCPVYKCYFCNKFGR